jgi:hypothetical protein
MLSDEVKSDTTTHKSRWGFHACSYQTYRKLRFLNFWYIESLKKAAAWERWNRKATQNRVIRKKLRDSQGNCVGYAGPVPQDEPKISTTFTERTLKRVYCHPHYNGGVPKKHGFEIPVIETYDYGVQEDYRRTQPYEKAEGVLPLKMSVELIDRLYAEAKAEFEDK